MCGRYYLKTPPAHIMAHFGLTANETSFGGSEDVRPTNRVPVVFNSSPEILKSARWGLIPFWSKDEKIGYKMINARAEGVGESKVFAPALRKRRCLIVADGFYEWRKNPNGSKTPMRFALRDGDLFAFAGLWETWKPKDAEPVQTCTIITTTPNELVEPVHDRMPVILAHDDESVWLDTEGNSEAIARSILKPYPADLMYSQEVSPAIFRRQVAS